MVCSHCPTLRSINRPIRNGLRRISGGVHTAQIQTLTQTSIGLCVNLLPPANEVAESYVFTPVCHSVHRRGSASGSGSVNTPPTHTPTPLDTPLHSQQAGGTHPTGMHSCWYLCLSRCLSRSVNAPLQATLKVYNRTCFERTPQSVAGVRGITAKLSSHVQICFERTSNTYTGRIQIIGIAGQELS